MNLFFKRTRNNTQNGLYNVGLVLSGGGTRGFAHLGVLKALEEHGMKPDIISGVSAGAIVGAFYADGRTPEEILELISSKKILQYIDFVIPKTGFLRMTGFEKTLNTHLRAKIFEDLGMPLNVYAVNMNTGIYTCFDKGPLARTIKASSSIPIMFAPVEIDGDYYVDGGLLNNFPVEQLRPFCKVLIGVNVNPVRPIKHLGGMRKVTERVFQLNIRGHAVERKRFCDIFIEPQGLTAFSMMNMASARTTFRLGYEATALAIKENDWVKKMEAIR